MSHIDRLIGRSEWLDDMIRRGRRDDLAAQFAHAELNTAGMHEGAAASVRSAAVENALSVELQMATNAYELADAVLMVGEKP